eukprot:m.217727 g.217727  ORF g.217727 m.217727 type:complete len:1179 (+) comp15891_c0_seq6:135-3671(+)
MVKEGKGVKWVFRKEEFCWTLREEDVGRPDVPNTLGDHGAVRPDLFFSVASEDARATAESLSKVFKKRGYVVCISSGTSWDPWYAAVSRAYVPFVDNAWLKTSMKEFSITQNCQSVSTDTQYALMVKMPTVKLEKVQTIMDKFTTVIDDPRESKLFEVLKKLNITPRKKKPKKMNTKLVEIKLYSREHGFGVTITSSPLGHLVTNSGDQHNLKPGDTIVKVNGLKMDSLSHGAVVKYLRELSSNKSEATIVVRRNATATSKSDHTATVLCCTFNAGNTEPDVHEAANWIPRWGKLPGTNAEYADIISIGLQESNFRTHRRNSSHMNSDTEDEGDESEEKSQKSSPIIATIEDQLLDVSTKKWDEVIGDCLGSQYVCVSSVRALQMRLKIYVRKVHEPHISQVHSQTASTGALGGVIANKGGQVVSMNFYDMPLVFANCHLASGNGDHKLENRLRDAANILGHARIGNPAMDFGSQFMHAFWMGDFNFRVDLRKTSQYADLADADHNAKALSLVANFDANIGILREADELNRVLRDKNIDSLHEWQSRDPEFAPSYKVLRDKELEYKKNRIPSWCDRVMFKSLPSLENHLTLDSYEICKDVKTSDHKPVRAIFSITIHPSVHFGLFRVRVEFSTLKASIKKNAKRDFLDVPDPYITLFSNPPSLMLGNHVLRDSLKGFTDRKGELRTTTLKNTYEPAWIKPDGKQSNTHSLTLLVDSLESLQYCHFLLCCRDHDVMSKDDELGAMALPFADLIDSMNRGVEHRTVGTLAVNGNVTGTLALTASMSVEHIQEPNNRSEVDTAPDHVTILGRTGKNAGMNGLYKKSVDHIFSSSPVYIKDGWNLFYYRGFWRVSRHASSVGSSSCVACIASTDAQDPTATSTHVKLPWRIHVGGQRAAPSEKSIWAFDRVVTCVRGGKLSPVRVSGLGSKCDGIYGPSDDEFNGSRIFYKQDQDNHDGHLGRIWLRWYSAPSRWAVGQQENIIAYMLAKDVTEPQCGANTWYEVSRSGNASVMENVKLTREADVIQSSNLTAASAPKNQLPKIEEKEISGDVESSKVKQVPAIPGAILIQEYDASQGDVLLRSAGNVPQLLGWCYFRSGRQFRSKPLSMSLVLPAKGTLRISVPPLLNVSARFRQAAEDSKNWVASGKQKTSDEGSFTSGLLELVSVYHMDVVCSFKVEKK